MIWRPPFFGLYYCEAGLGTMRVLVLAKNFFFNMSSGYQGLPENGWAPLDFNNFWNSDYPSPRPFFLDCFPIDLLCDFFYLVAIFSAQIARPYIARSHVKLILLNSNFQVFILNIAQLQLPKAFWNSFKALCTPHHDISHIPTEYISFW